MGALSLTGNYITPSLAANAIKRRRVGDRHRQIIRTGGWADRLPGWVEYIRRLPHLVGWNAARPGQHEIVSRKDGGDICAGGSNFQIHRGGAE